MASYHVETSADGGLTWRGHGELAPATKREAVKMAQQMLSLLPTQQARILAVYKAKYRGVAIVWTGEPAQPKKREQAKSDRRLCRHLGVPVDMLARMNDHPAPYRVKLASGRVNDYGRVVASFAWRGEAVLTARVVAYANPDAYVYIAHAEGWA